MSTAATLAQLCALLRAEGGLLAAALYPSGPVVPADDPGLGMLAAAGPRSAGHAEPIALAVEAAREADLLHGGRSRIMDASDRDLAILAGDRLYALGLARLAEIGAVAAVSELADVIALCARARVDAA